MQMAHVNKLFVWTGFPRPGSDSGSLSGVGANLVFALFGTEGRSQEGRSQGSPLQQIALILFILSLTACSGCNKSKTNDAGTDTSTETSTETDDLDGGTDTDTNDTETETTITDAGVWDWVDLPPVPDSGVEHEYQKLTYEGAPGGDDYDVWEDLLVYVDKSDSDFSIVTVVDVKNRKKLRMPFVMQGCVDSNDICWQEEVTLYENIVFYSNRFIDMSLPKDRRTDQIIKVDLEKKTQEIIWSRKWPDGVTSYQSPNQPDIYGDRLVYQEACDFIPGQNVFCLFDSPWTGDENQSVLWDDADYNGQGYTGPFLSIWGNTLVSLETEKIDAGLYTTQKDITGYSFTNNDEKKWYKITDDNEFQSYPRIHENTVVWNDWRFGDGEPSSDGWRNVAVFAKDISNENNEEIQITDGVALAIMPDVFNDIVVWKEFRHCPVEFQNSIGMDECSEIYGYNLITKKEMRITNWQGAKKEYVRIWGDRIFVMASDNGWFYYTIDVPEELKTP